MARLCWAQSILACIAVIATVWEVETIIWHCPAMGALGLLIAVLSIKRNSIRLLTFGLYSPIVTSLISLLIGTFHISPSTASKFVWIILVVNAVVNIAWCISLTQRTNKDAADAIETGADVRIRFSILHILIGTTLVCLLLSVVRAFQRAGEMALFAGYGIGILSISVALLVWFTRRAKLYVRQCEELGNEASPTIRSEQSAMNDN